MKKFLLPILLLSAGTSFAQQKNEAPFRSLYELSKGKGIPGKMEFQLPLAFNKSKERLQVQPGKVIILPLDNMPCLLPDVSGFNMPVRSGDVNGNMPVLVPVK